MSRLIPNPNPEQAQNKESSLAAAQKHASS
jgi:hypothetical protein